MKTKILKYSLITAVLGIVMWSCNKEEENVISPNNNIEPNMTTTQSIFNYCEQNHNDILEDAWFTNPMNSNSDFETRFENYFQGTMLTQETISEETFDINNYSWRLTKQDFLDEMNQLKIYHESFGTQYQQGKLNEIISAIDNFINNHDVNEFKNSLLLVPRPSML